MVDLVYWCVCDIFCRDYIEKMLKIRGIRRALNFLEKLHLVVLKKTRMTLEKLEVGFSYYFTEDSRVHL